MPDNPQPVWAFEDFLHLVPSYGWIRDYLAYAIQCTDAPPIYHIIAASSFVSNVISGNKVVVAHFNGEPIPLHMFWLLTGESGTRKSAAIRRATKIVTPVYAKLGLGDRIWFPESCSVEGIIEGFEADPNRILVVSEWTELNANMQASYTKSSPEFWNLVHDGSPIMRRKVNGKIVMVPDPRISVLGASIPKLVKASVSTRDWVSGKFARYVIAYMAKPADKEMPYALEIPNAVASLQTRFEDFFCEGPPSKMNRFTLTAAAREYKEEWEHSQDWLNFRQSLPEHLAPSALRAGDHAFRLATVYQASMDYPWEMDVGVEAMEAAGMMIWTCALTMLSAFATLPMNDQQPADRVLAVLKAAGLKGIVRRELMRKLHMQAQQLDPILRMLAETRELLTWQMHNGNPLYHHVQPESE